MRPNIACKEVDKQQVCDLIKKSDSIYEDHIQMQLFKHALPVEIKLAVNLAKPTTSEQAYNIANMQFQTAVKKANFGKKCKKKILMQSTLYSDLKAIFEQVPEI